MNKVIVKMPPKNHRKTAMDKIKRELGQLHGCYVLITCTEPSGEGKMEVEMNYEGDETLAAFLLENASQVFDEKLNPTRETK